MIMEIRVVRTFSKCVVVIVIVINHGGVDESLQDRVSLDGADSALRQLRGEGRGRALRVRTRAARTHARQRHCKQRTSCCTFYKQYV